MSARSPIDPCPLKSNPAIFLKSIRTGAHFDGPGAGGNVNLFHLAGTQGIFFLKKEVKNDLFSEKLL
jgi:hypothetical protein